MPDKIVQVGDKVVSFPETMSDDEISRAISGDSKTFGDQVKDFGSHALDSFIGTLTSPIKMLDPSTYSNAYDQTKHSLGRAGEEFHKGHLADAAANAVTAIPFVGPMLTEGANHLQAGEYGAAAGDTTGLVGGVSALKGAPKVLGKGMDLASEAAKSRAGARAIGSAGGLAVGSTVGHPFLGMGAGASIGDLLHRKFGAPPEAPPEFGPSNIARRRIDLDPRTFVGEHPMMPGLPEDLRPFNPQAAPQAPNVDYSNIPGMGSSIPQGASPQLPQALPVKLPRGRQVYTEPRALPNSEGVRQSLPPDTTPFNPPPVETQITNPHDVVNPKARVPRLNMPKTNSLTNPNLAPPEEGEVESPSGGALPVRDLQTLAQEGKLKVPSESEQIASDEAAVRQVKHKSPTTVARQLTGKGTLAEGKEVGKNPGAKTSPTAEEIGKALKRALEEKYDIEETEQ